MAIAAIILRKYTAQDEDGLTKNISKIRLKDIILAYIHAHTRTRTNAHTRQKNSKDTIIFQASCEITKIIAANIEMTIKC